jgi:hypothetical protein
VPLKTICRKYLNQFLLGCEQYPELLFKESSGKVFCKALQQALEYLSVNTYVSEIRVLLLTSERTIHKINYIERKLPIKFLVLRKCAICWLVDGASLACLILECIFYD